MPFRRPSLFSFSTSSLLRRLKQLAQKDTSGIMSRSSATTLLLLLAYICIAKDVYCSCLKIFDQRSFEHANGPLSVQRADDDSIVGEGSNKSCWSPCDRLTSSRSHLPVYDSVVPGARHRSRTSTKERENAESNEEELLANVARSKQVVLLQTHHLQDFTPEFVSHIGSLIAESAPRRVFILFHCQDVARDIKALPLSLRPFVYPYTHADIEAVYFYEESAEAWDLKFHTDLPAMLFLLSHPWFDFAWVIEDDVRLTGNWDNFFSESFQEAERTQLSKTTQERQDWKRNRTDSEKAKEEISRQKTVTGMKPSIRTELLVTPADLLIFANVAHPSPSWGWRVHANNIPDHAKRHALLTIRGLSRRLIQAMHAHFLRNVTAYFEMFAPSVAHMSGLTTTFVQQYNVSGSLSCCSSEALRVYNNWLTGNGTGCRAPVLVHPVKSRDVPQDLFEKGIYARNCAM